MGGALRKNMILEILVSLFVAAAIVAAFVGAPTEFLMGDVQRIFYFHVPSAWIAFLAYFLVFCFSIAYLATRKPAWDRRSLAAAEVGTLFCTIVLITGPLWAKPVWGIWWTWDARLTSTFVLWLIYLSYLLLRSALKDSPKTALLSAVVGIIGFLDVPIVYFAIRLWRTQHPKPVILGGAKSGLEPAMFWTLMLCWAALTLLFALLIRRRLQLLNWESRIKELEES